jgi:hypothetical protein
MKSVKIREIAEALRCVTLGFPDDGGLTGQHLSVEQSEMLTELAIRGMVEPTEDMLRAGVTAAPVDDDGDDMLKVEVEEIWEAMVQEALR